MDMREAWVTGRKAPFRLLEVNGRVVEASGDPGAKVVIERGDVITQELADRLVAMFDNNGLVLSEVDAYEGST